MRSHNQSGELNVLLIPFLLISILLIAVAVFAYNTYGEKENYKNHTDKIVAQAKLEAKKDEAAAKTKEFVEQQKQPLISYTAPGNDGSVNVMYPKTWSGYIDDSGSGGGVFDAYFNPAVVQSDDGGDSTTPYALRISLVNQTYDQTLQNYSDQVSQKTVTSQPYHLPKVPSVIGTRLTGQIQSNKKGQEIILPLRGNTLEIWTESDSYVQDFNKYILPNLTFSP